MAITPESHISAMRDLCEKLKSDPLIHDIDINDWGRYSNFDIHIVPSEHTRHTTRKLKALVKKALKDTGAHLREVFPPTAEYRWCTVNQKNELIGYDRGYWAFDIDYQEYDFESNSFEEKTSMRGNAS